MAKRTASLECTDCGEKFSISASSPDSISYCPFCGASIGVPTEDVDEERDYDDEDENLDDE
jgi:hypothetical protein